MARVSASMARQKFSEIVSRAEFAGERTILHRRKKPVAAVVPIEDLQLIRKLEDEADLKAARRARKEKGGITLERLKKELGL